MVLSDYEIIKSVLEDRDIVIEPFNRGAVQPSSIDVHLDGRFKIFHREDTGAIDPLDLEVRGESMYEELVINGDQEFYLEPGQFALASTVERFEIPDDMAARLDGKSSLGRLGLLVHSTAGWIDPGFKGTVTLELSNIAPREIILRKDMAIGQVSFMNMRYSAVRAYGSEGLGSKYQGQAGPTISRYQG